MTDHTEPADRRNLPTVVARPESGGVRVRVHGEFDLSNAGEVATALIAAERTDAAAVVLDLSAVSFMDSAGLRTVVQAAARSRRDSDRLQIIVSPFVEDLIAVSGLQDRLPVTQDPAGVEERVVLVGGPCSGRIHDVAPHTPEVSARDSTGRRHVYTRTQAVDLAPDLRVVLFRFAGSEPAT